ncbi:MAG TPA: ABC transporter permease [Caldilineae bacterium]|nr:ABC transporter permease [Caldilineae bacterium]
MGESSHPFRTGKQVTFLSGSSRFWRRFARNRLALLGALIILMLLICALLAPLIAPYDPIKTNIRARLQGPSAEHLFGTDDLGRDIFSRVLYGTRISLKVGLISVSISTSIGLLLGLFSGYLGGWVDTLVMRVMDVLFAFPAVLLAIAIMAVLGQSTTNVMIAVGIVYVPIFARITRGSVLAVRELEFIEAARCIGLRDVDIVFRHVLPNALDAVIVQVSLATAFAILAEAALSFLGLGTQPPDPSWGSMLSFGREYMLEAPWWTIFPGLAIFLTVLALHLIGDGLRDALDPRSDVRV